MKITSSAILFATASSIAAGQSVSEECIEICSIEFENIDYSSVCRAARTFTATDDTRSKPTVYQICRKAWGYGFDDACMSTCVGEESKKESEALCKKEKRNISREWCGKTYKEAYGYTERLVSKTRPKAAARESKPVSFLDST